MASEEKDRTLRNFFRDGSIAFCISSFTINPFKLFTLSGTDIVRYLFIKFTVCLFISIYAGLGRIFANYIYYVIKKNTKNEQHNWRFR